TPIHDPHPAASKYTFLTLLPHAEGPNLPDSFRLTNPVPFSWLTQTRAEANMWLSRLFTTPT
ncbi:hypothetical protein, partial [uncultured Corynebacterium sp.]|uniref:hypothetical protein n=1 Tax=uncultured Corynebacterium sp. TaxID=159447 RepID=UPI0026388AAB